MEVLRRPKRGVKGLIVLVILLLLSIILFVNLNPLISFITEQIIIHQIEKRVTFEVSCQSLKADIFTDRVIIEGAKIVSAHQFGEEPFLYIPRIEGYFRYKSLFKKKIIMDDFVYYEPQVFLECSPEGRWNFPDKKEFRRGRWFFTQSHWRVKGGRLVIKDGWVSPEPFLLIFENIEVRATGFSNQVPSYGRYCFEGELVSPGPLPPIKGKGRVDSFREPVDHTLHLVARDLDLPYFNSYQKRITPFNLTKGKMDLETELKYSGKRLEGENGLKVKGLVLEGPKGAVIFCPQMSAKLFSQFLPEKSIILDEITLSDPTVQLSRDKKGEWNLPRGLEEGERAWSLVVNSLVVKDGKVVFRDERISLKTLLTELENVNLRMEHLSPPPYRIHYEVRALLNQAPLEAKGEINSFRETYDFNLDLSLKGLDLAPFDPYQRKITSCQLVKGRMDLETDLECKKNNLDSLNIVTFENLELQPLLGVPTSPIKVMGMGPAILATVLRDGEGKIRLVIPVKGDIADPEFRVGSALLKASIRAIQEIIVAPFGSVAKLITNKEGTSKIYLLPLEFVKGSARLTKGAITKLVDLSRLLIKYPATPLHIEGYVDPLSEKGLWKGTNLAQKRAKRIADYLIKEAKIPKEKIRLSAKEEQEKKEAEIKIEE